MNIPDIDFGKPIPTVARVVPDNWTDNNGHMNESRYLQAFSDATDRFMQIIGVDADYIAAGASYFTVETHICHLDETQAGAIIRVNTQCLRGQGKKLHLFSRIFEGERLLATGEQMLIHVSLKTRRATQPGEHILQRLNQIAKAQAALPQPKQLGRAIKG